MTHKKNRRLAIGPNANVYFEDRLTMHYQVQEMLRAEKIFQGQEIDEELATYNPLIPDGSNWKGTFMIEYDDPEVRSVKLNELIGVEQALWFQVGEHEKSRQFLMKIWNVRPKQKLRLYILFGSN